METTRGHKGGRGGPFCSVVYSLVHSLIGTHVHQLCSSHEGAFSQSVTEKSLPPEQLP